MEEMQRPCCDRECVAVAVQRADVSLPVAVKPCARIKCVETKCCGEPIICMKHHCGCPDACEFVISQSIVVEVKVEISAEAEAGTPCAVCRRPFAAE